MYDIFLIHLSVSGHLVGFYVLAIGNGAAIRGEVSSLTMFFPGYIPRSGNTGFYGNSIFNFKKNLHTILHNGWTNLHSHHQWRKVSFSSHPSQHLLFVDSLTVTVLNGVRRCLVVGLTCISLILSNVGHLFKCKPNLSFFFFFFFFLLYVFLGEMSVQVFCPLFWLSCLLFVVEL